MVVTGDDGVMVVELRVQVEPAAGTEQVSVTGFANPAIGVVVTTTVLLRPPTTVPEPGAPVKVKSIPLPVRVVGAPAPALWTVIDPGREPVVVGLKVIVTAQLELAATVPPHAAVDAV